MNDPDLARCTARLDGDFLFFSNVGFRCVVSTEGKEDSDESEYLFRKAFDVPQPPKAETSGE